MRILFWCYVAMITAGLTVSIVIGVLGR